MSSIARFFGQKDTDYVSSIPYGNNKEAGHFVTSDDAKIYYETYGNKDNSPVLILHGGSLGCTYEMGQFIDKLVYNYYIIAVSTRGHVKSEIGKKPFTYEQKATDVYNCVKDATNKPVIVIGFSDGAYTSYKLASMHPEIVTKIVAIGAGENIPQLRQIIPTKMKDIRKIDPKFFECMESIMPEPDKFEELWENISNLYNNITVSKDLFGSIQCPVLLISGEKDPNAPLSTIISAYYMIRNCQLAIIANAPHQCMITNFSAVWENIVPFISE